MHSYAVALWVMEAESAIVGWSECFTDADDFYERTGGPMT